MKDGALLRQIIDENGSLNLDDYEESRAFAGVYESTNKELKSAGGGQILRAASRKRRFERRAATSRRRR